MKITGVRLTQLEGTFNYEGDFWEERLVRPVDIYPEHRAEGAAQLERVALGSYRLRAIYLQLDTNEGITGVSGPIDELVAFIIDRRLKPLLLGQDPMATELVWDKMYRFSIHGRKGETMMAISAVDCALWDLKGKWAGVPTYRLLGGPTRDRIPAYASMLGFSIQPEAVRARVKEFVGQGYRAMKWFFRHDPTEGHQGMAKNLELVRTAREAAGDDVDLMFDAWSSWDVPYTLKMAEQMVQYNPRWIEEPVLADKLESYAQIRRASPVPISGGEHEYTRWGFKALLDAEAVDVLQPDVTWAGGLSEAVKICALASTYDTPVVCHHGVPQTLHLAASQAPTVVGKLFDRVEPVT